MCLLVPTTPTTPLFRSFAKLVADTSGQVREQFTLMIGRWMHDLPDRVDHQTRILPYVMTGLTDDAQVRVVHTASPPPVMMLRNLFI